MTNLSLTGIILAGGKSSRFKSPKYLATIKDKSLLEIAISKLEPLCSEIIVVSKDNLGSLPLEGGGFGVGALFDDHPPLNPLPLREGKKIENIIEKDKAHHPLIGIREGLEASHNEDNIVLACDMPFISSKTILALINSKAEVCLYRHQGKIEPLVGFYRKSCLGKIAPFKSTSIVNAIAKCNIDYINVEDEWLDFFNINTREDLIEAEKIAQGNPQLLGN